MTNTALEFHPVASIFPLMSEDEYQALKEDITANGLREPIWLHEGKVIDGRNRARACEELGIEPETREWDGRGSLVDFVASENLHRRHLTSSQRAACGTEIEERLAIEAKERQRASGGDRKSQAARAEKSEVQKVAQPIHAPKAREQAAAIVGSNRQYIQDAKAVKAKAPELHEKVKAGKMTLPQAKREVIRQEKREALDAKAKTIELKPADHSWWEIHVTDCVQFLRSRPKGSARLLFADPPYNIGIQYGDHHNDRMSDSEYLAWCREWLSASIDVLTDDGSLWLLVSDDYADDLGVMLRRDLGLHRRAWIKWYESFGVNNATNFNRTSRHLFYMVKNPDRFAFNPDAVTRPSDRQAKYGDKRADPGGKIWDDVWGINPPIPRLTGTSAERLPDFPTQLPLALLTAIVGCASEPGDLVVDPFSGSATTGEACIWLGRRYWGVELSEAYADIARKRLAIVSAGVSAANAS